MNTATNIEPKITLTLTIEQARAVSEGLDLLTRLSIGQFDEIAQLVRQGVTPVYASHTDSRQIADVEVCDQVAALAREIGASMGYAPGSSLGIGHPHVLMSGRRAYEVAKVLDQALAFHQNPNPSFHGVNYDGLIVRYTQDPAPVATIS